MVNKNNFFFEEELKHSKKKGGGNVPKVLPSSITKQSSSRERIKSLFPVNKPKTILNGQVAAHKNQKLVIKITKDSKSPKTKYNQYDQFLYLSRLEEKEKVDEAERAKYENTYLYDHNDRIVAGKKDMVLIAESWANDKYRKEDESVSRHMVLSIGDKVEDKDKILVVTSQFLKDTIGSKGFEYCYAPHFDTDHDHIHVIIKKRNALGKNFRFSKADIQKFKAEYKMRLDNVGIIRDISRRLEDDEVIMKIREGQEGLTGDNSWYQAKLNKGNSKEFNAYTYKSTLAGKIEEQSNLVKIKGYLEALGVEDKGLINVIKPYLAKKGVEAIEEALVAVKQMKEKGQINNINGLIIKAIQEDYKANFSKESFKLSREKQQTVQELKNIKKEIVDQTEKEGIFKVLNNTKSRLEKFDNNVAAEIGEIFADSEVRYSYVKARKEVKDLEKARLIQKEVDKSQKSYYRPELSNYQIQEKFIAAIRETVNISAEGLESAVAKAFGAPNQKIRFGRKQENEVCWYGEAGFVKNYKTGEYLSWGVNNIKQDGSTKFKQLTEEELKQKLEESAKTIAKQRAEKELKYEEVAKRSEKAFSELSKSGYSKYLERKGFNEQDLAGKSIKFKENNIVVVPLVDIEGKIWNLQTIDEEGVKRFRKDGKKQGNFFLINKNGEQIIENNSNVLLVAEGLATALTVHRASGNLDTIACFDAGNLDVTITNVKNKFPDRKIIIMADDDEKADNKINVGLDKAMKVKEKFNDVGVLAPNLSRDEKLIQKLSDWNDLEKARGEDFVKQRIKEEIAKISNQLLIKIGL